MADAQAKEKIRALGREVRAEAAALAADLAARDDAALEASSACKGWAVRDVAAHVTQGAERAVDVVRYALQGSEPPPFSPQQRLARMREMRALSGPELAARLPRDLDTAFTLLEGAPVEAYDTVVTVPAGPHTLLQFASQRLSEAALHGWDVRSATEPDAILRPEAAAEFIDYLISRMPRMVHAEPGQNATYRFDLTGPGGGPVTVSIRDGQGTAERGVHEAAELALALPVEAFIRLAWGRLDVGRELGAGKADLLEGDRASATRLQMLFPGH